MYVCIYIIYTYHIDVYIYIYVFICVDGMRCASVFHTHQYRHVYTESCSCASCADHAHMAPRLTMTPASIIKSAAQSATYPASRGRKRGTRGLVIVPIGLSQK